TESKGNKVARITTTGDIREFALPTPDSIPRGITTGPDGRLWFAEEAGRVGVVSPDGSGLNEFTPPTPSSGPFDLTTGVDGRVWFSERDVNKWGALDPKTNNQIPGYARRSAPSPNGVVTGDDGRVYYAGFMNSTVDAVT